MTTLSDRQVAALVARLRLDPSDNGGPSRMDMLRERQEAADLIEVLSLALAEAGGACDKARACLARWQAGHVYDPAGPEAAIQQQLYEVVRPGARAGLSKLHAIVDSQTRA